MNTVRETPYTPYSLLAMARDIAIIVFVILWAIHYL